MGIFEVQEVFQISGVGIVLAGVVKSGSIAVGSRASLGGQSCRLKSIEKHRQVLSFAAAGDAVGILFEGLSDKNALKRGQLIEIQ